MTLAQAHTQRVKNAKAAFMWEIDEHQALRPKGMDRDEYVYDWLPKHMDRPPTLRGALKILAWAAKRADIWYSVKFTNSGMDSYGAEDGGFLVRLVPEGTRATATYLFDMDWAHDGLHEAVLHAIDKIVEEKPHILDEERED